MGLFRKSAIQPTIKNSVSDLSYTITQKSEVLVKGLDSVTCIKNVKVPVDVLPALPSMNEYDLEEMLKNGYNPQPINTHGMLVDNSYDVNSDLNSLQELANKSDSVSSNNDVNTVSDDETNV